MVPQPSAAATFLMVAKVADRVYVWNVGEITVKVILYDPVKNRSGTKDSL